MTRMTAGLRGYVQFNKYTHTHTQLFIHIADSIIVKRGPLRIEINRSGKQHLLQEKNYEYCKPLDLHT